MDRDGGEIFLAGDGRNEAEPLINLGESTT
jgi:hypothetical protein